jgi:hypothetical protein
MNAPNLQHLSIDLSRSSPGFAPPPAKYTEIEVAILTKEIDFVLDVSEVQCDVLTLKGWGTSFVGAPKVRSVHHLNTFDSSIDYEDLKALGKALSKNPADPCALELGQNVVLNVTHYYDEEEKEEEK